jgi:hypothetical protein
LPTRVIHLVPPRRRAEKLARFGLLIGLAFLGASCGGGTQASVTLSPVAAPAPPVGNWIDYATSVNPGSAIQFVSASDGWRLDGQEGAPYLDQDIAAGPGRGSAIVDWPGASVSSSSDGGKTWTTIFTGTDGIWGLDLLSADVGWVVGVTSLSRTTDGGSSWQQMGEPQGQFLVAVDFSSSGTGFGITTKGQLVSTTDGGSSWAPSGFTGSAGSFCFTSSQTGYVADQSGNVFTTADGGADWGLSRETQVPSDLQPGIWVGLSCSPANVVQAVDVLDVAVNPPVEPYVVSESTDGGLTWSVLADSSSDPGFKVPIAPGPVQQLAGATIFASASALIVGFPMSGWRLQIATANRSSSAASQVPDLPTASTPGQSAGYMIVHGLSAVGLSGWLLLNDNAVGPDNSPETESILLRTTNGGSSWNILESGAVGAPPSPR